jgi:hypothetical protein
METIEGVKIDVKSDEMKTALTDRATHHKQRAAMYREQADTLRAQIGATVEKIKQEVDDEDDAASKIGAAYGSSYRTEENPLTILQNKARKHRERHAFFSFMAEHVIAGATYRLKEEDLARLELLSRHL